MISLAFKKFFREAGGQAWIFICGDRKQFLRALDAPWCPAGREQLRWIFNCGDRKFPARFGCSLVPGWPRAAPLDI